MSSATPMAMSISTSQPISTTFTDTSLSGHSEDHHFSSVPMASPSPSPSVSPIQSRFTFPPQRSSSSMSNSHPSHHHSRSNSNSNAHHNYSPQKPPSTQPNPHPYAIKTTSTALLSRSSSTSSAASPSLNGVPGEGHGNVLYQDRHRYIPPVSPSPISGSDKEGEAVLGQELEKKGRRHRYSRSLTGEGPVPFPPPPRAPASIGHGHSGSQDFSANSVLSPSTSPTFNRPTHQERRQSARDYDDFMLGSSTISVTHHLTANAISYTSSDPLPTDPKSWTSQQLAAYLTMSEDNDENDVSRIELAKYVKEKGISGRAFMRISGEIGSESLPPPTRAALISASRTLRQQALRDRILGPSSSAVTNEPESYAIFPSAPISLQSTGNSVVQDDFDQDFNPSSTDLPTNNTGSVTVTRKNAVRPKRLSGDRSGGAPMVKPKQRQRGRQMSDASDASDISASSLSSNASGSSSASNSRVKRMASEFEEKHREGSGGGLDEEGSASENGGAGEKERERKKSSATRKALPTRGNVADLFSPSNPPATVPPSQNVASVQNPSSSLFAIEEKDSTIQGLARKNVHGREPRMLPFPPSVPPVSAGYSSKPGFQQPMPTGHPSGWNQQVHSQNRFLTPMHTGAEYPLPTSPTPGTGDYELGFRRSPNEVATFVVRHNPSPGTSANGRRKSPGNVSCDNSGKKDTNVPADVNATTSATGTGSHGYSSGVSSSTSTSPPSTSPSVPVATGSPKLPRLLPYPPVMGHAALHHPRPRKVGGPGAGEVEDGMRKEGLSTEKEDAEEGIGGKIGVGTESGPSVSTSDVWLTALESPSISSSSGGSTVPGRKGDDIATRIGPEGTKSILPRSSPEDEPTMEDLLDLLSREDKDHQPPNGAYRTPSKASISGVDAWEMELGDTVKRVGTGVNGKERVSIRVKPRDNKTGSRRISSLGIASSSMRNSATNNGIMDLFKEAKEEDEKEKQMNDSKSKELNHRDSALTDREIDLDRREAAVRDAEEKMREREASVDAKELENRVRKMQIAEREDAVARGERDLDQRQRYLDGEHQVSEEQNRVLADRQYALEEKVQDMARRAQALQERENDLHSKEHSLEQRENALVDRERALDRRESASCRWEEKLGEREGRLGEREVEVGERESEVRKRESSVEEKERVVTQKALIIEREKTNIETQTEAITSTDQSNQTNGDLNPARPAPYLTTPWAIRRDLVLGRFVGAFTGGFGGGLGGFGNLVTLARESGGYLVIMSIGVCAFMLREMLGMRGGRLLFGARR